MYTHTHIRVFAKCMKYKRVAMRHSLSYKQHQVFTFYLKKQKMSGLAVAVDVADRFTIGNRRLP